MMFPIVSFEIRVRTPGKLSVYPQCSHNTQTQIIKFVYEFPPLQYISPQMASDFDLHQQIFIFLNTSIVYPSHTTWSHLFTISGGQRQSQSRIILFSNLWRNKKSPRCIYILWIFVILYWCDTSGKIKINNNSHKYRSICKTLFKCIFYSVSN